VWGRKRPVTFAPSLFSWQAFSPVIRFLYPSLGRGAAEGLSFCRFPVFQGAGFFTSFFNPAPVFIKKIKKRRFSLDIPQRRVILTIKTLWIVQCLDFLYLQIGGQGGFECFPSLPPLLCPVKSRENSLSLETGKKPPKNRKNERFFLTTKNRWNIFFTRNTFSQISFGGRGFTSFLPRPPFFPDKRGALPDEREGEGGWWKVERDDAELLDETKFRLGLCDAAQAATYV